MGRVEIGKDDKGIPIPAKIVFVRDRRLTIAKRTYQASQPLRPLFHACCEELEQVASAEALAMMLMLLKQALANVPEMTSELIQSLI